MVEVHVRNMELPLCGVKHVEVRSIIRYLTTRNKTAKEIPNEIQHMYGVGCTFTCVEVETKIHSRSKSAV